jgi:hypothetical protein
MEFSMQRQEFSFACGSSLDYKGFIGEKGILCFCFAWVIFVIVQQRPAHVGNDIISQIADDALVTKPASLEFI